MSSADNIRLRGKNIGPFESFDIMIPSVTLIAGENGTGKSTISKSLYMLLNANRSIEALIDKEKRDLNRKFPFINQNISSKLLEKNILFQPLNLQEAVARFQSLETKQFDEFDSELRNTIIKRLISAEFSSQVLRNGTKEGSISAEADSLHSSIDISSEDYKFVSDISVDSSVLYFDTVGFIEQAYKRNQSIINHQNGTYQQLQKAIENIKSNQESLFSELDRNKMIKTFGDKLHDIIRGRFDYDPDDKSYYYESQGIKYSLDNVASGVKAFSALDLFIKYGVIRDDSTIILDELETNLHPLWQVRFAELLVSLSENTGIRVVVNSHSPFFIEALELCCSRKLNKDDYRLYFTEMDKGIAAIKDVSSDSSSIFDSLAAPYDVMDKIWSHL